MSRCSSPAAGKPILAIVEVRVAQVPAAALSGPAGENDLAQDKSLARGNGLAQDKSLAGGSGLAQDKSLVEGNGLAQDNGLRAAATPLGILGPAGLAHAQVRARPR